MKLPSRPAIAACLLLVINGLIAAPPTADLADLEPSEIRRTIPSKLKDATLIGGKTIDGYPVIGDPVSLTTEQAAAVKKAVNADAAFAETTEERCPFRPGVAFRFGSGDDAKDLLVCFACDEVVVVPVGGAASGLVAMSQETRLGLLNVAKAALPSDEGVQGLPDVRKDPDPSASQ